jgi:hypothetical protein
MRENVYSSAYYIVHFRHTINNSEFRISIDHYAAYFYLFEYLIYFHKYVCMLKESENLLPMHTYLRVA